jgi:hypothetical protein
MFESIKDFLGIGGNKKSNTPSLTTSTTGEGAKIAEPLWLQRSKETLGGQSLKHNIEQSMRERTTPTGTSSTPSSEGTGESPFVLGAMQKTLPVKEMDSPAIQEGKATATKEEREKGIKAASSNAGSPSSLKEDLELREQLPHP